MSVLDQFRDAERRVAERLNELEPAVAEYRELEEVARRLGLDVTTSQAAVAPSPPRQRRAGRTTKPAPKAPRRARSVASVKATGAPDTAPRRTMAKGGERGAQLLTLVQKRPGITVAEAGKELWSTRRGCTAWSRRSSRTGRCARTGAGSIRCPHRRSSRGVTTRRSARTRISACPRRRSSTGIGIPPRNAVTAPARRPKRQQRGLPTFGLGAWLG